MTNSTSDDVFTLMSRFGKSVEPEMQKFLLKGVHSEFQDLIMWQTDSGGKRLRPALTIIFAQTFGASIDAQEVLAAAAGIELIHSYSLILDDIIASGKTMIQAVKKVKSEGAKKVIAAATHGIFMKDSLIQLKELTDYLVVTDSISTPVSNVSVAPLIIEELKK